MNNCWNEVKREEYSHLVENSYKIIKEILEQQKGKTIKVRSRSRIKDYEGRLISVDNQAFMIREDFGNEIFFGYDQLHLFSFPKQSLIVYIN